VNDLDLLLPDDPAATLAPDGPGLRYLVLPELVVPLAQPRVFAYALRSALLPPTRAKAARNAALLALVRAGRPLKAGEQVVVDAADPTPALVRTAQRLGAGEPAGWLLQPGSSDALSRGVFAVFAAGADAPHAVLKFARVPGYSEPFDRDERALRLVAQAGGAVAAHAPRLLARGEHGGRCVSLETAAPGPRLVAYLTSRAARADRAAALDRVARWTIDVARETRVPRADDERYGADPVLDRVPGVFAHDDLGTWNVLVDGTSFAAVDWESATPRGLPLADLTYLLFYGLAALHGATPDAAYFADLFGGARPESARVFELVREAAAVSGVADEDVGAVVGLSWLRHGRSHLARGAALAAHAEGAQAATTVTQACAEAWRTDPRLGAAWPARRAERVEVARPSIVSSGAWSAASRLLPALYTLVLSVVAARVLGPGDMGRQSFVAFVSATAVTLATAGLPVAVMRHVGEAAGARRWQAIRALLRWALRLELGAAVLGAATLAGIGVTRDSFTGAWVLAGLTCGLLVLQTVPSAVLIGLQRWRQASLAGVVTGGVGVTAAVVVLALGGGVTGMFAVDLAVAAVNLAWISRYAARAVRALPHSGSEPEVTRRAGRYALGASVQAVLALVVWRRSEFFFLALYATSADIAVYSIAFATATALALLPQGIAAVLGPAVATMHGAGEADRIVAAFSRGVRLLAVLTLPLTAGVLATGTLLLRLVYGTEYARAGTVLLWLMVAFPLLPLYHLGTGLLTGLGRQRDIVAANLAAAAANVALDVVLIPRHGAVGAAVANAGAQVAGSLLVMTFAVRALPRLDVRPLALARAAAAAAATGAAAWAVLRVAGGWLGLLLAVLAGTAAFALAAKALRVLPAEDAEWLGGRLPGPARRAVRALA
jgi:O-antigen/teichoic acid export membrane protein